MTDPLRIDLRAFRGALGAFATGVTIVTTRDKDGRDVGLTANSFNSVSLEPPMVLWSLGKTSQSLKAFVEAGHFAVHILSIDQDSLSGRFAKSGGDKFVGLTVERGQGQIPLLDGCAARFECRSAFQYDGGDHVIFVGEVIALDHSGRPPLVFHGGRYAAVIGTSEAARQEPRAATEGGFGEDFLGYLLGRAHYQFFARMRPELERRVLREEEYTDILSVLSLRDNRSVTELNALVEFTGYHVTQEAVASLEKRGLVSLDSATDPDPRVQLTAEGRRTVIELIAVAKSIEADAEADLDQSERLVLRRLLKKVLRNTDPGLPSLWEAE
jgi:3-hydroxy-9,10-secoandrosta-1,3,5(10)-triene-9,17-dione monooxygenase reductase component